MVSSTKQTERRRRLKHSSKGKANAKARARTGTPAFSVHPQGYDPKAPDAKKPSTPSAQ
jgi:hypothetical protein